MLAGHFDAEVLVREPCGDAAARGAVEEADLNQEGLIDLFESILLFGECGSERVQAYRAAVIFFDDGAKQAAVELVEAVGINFQHFKSRDRSGTVDAAGGADFGVVADTAK